MRKYIFISAGGFIGASLRFIIKNISIYGYKENIPLNTFIINITGSFLLALITTAALEVINVDKDIKNGICTGFLGAYTTFSTLCKETAGLFMNGSYFSAVSYAANSAILGIVAAYFGVIVAREYIPRIVKKDYEDEELEAE